MEEVVEQGGEELAESRRSREAKGKGIEGIGWRRGVGDELVEIRNRKDNGREKGI